MRNWFIDFGDTLFAVAIAAAIGICAANLAVQIQKERDAIDAAIAKDQAAYRQVSGEGSSVTNVDEHHS